jgi:hypothetical protein
MSQVSGRPENLALVKVWELFEKHEAPSGSIFGGQNKNYDR